MQRRYASKKKTGWIYHYLEWNFGSVIQTEHLFERRLSRWRAAGANALVRSRLCDRNSTKVFHFPFFYRRRECTFSLEMCAHNLWKYVHTCNLLMQSCVAILMMQQDIFLHTGCSLNIVFFLKIVWIFWTLSVLLQRWCSTCLVCVHTLTSRENRVRKIY